MSSKNTPHMAGLIFAPGWSAWMVIIGAADAASIAQAKLAKVNSVIRRPDFMGSETEIVFLIKSYGIGFGNTEGVGRRAKTDEATEASEIGAQYLASKTPYCHSPGNR